MSTRICDLCRQPWKLCKGHGRLSITVEAETVPCGLCGKPTTSTGTKRCDRCWELERRIQSDPEIALRILTGIYDQGFPILTDVRHIQAFVESASSDEVP